MLATGRSKSAHVARDVPGQGKNQVKDRMKSQSARRASILVQRDSLDDEDEPILNSKGLRRRKGASAPQTKSSNPDRRLDSAASTTSASEQTAVNTIRIVENMLVTPNTLPSIFSNLYQSLNLVQNQMNETKEQTTTATGFVGSRPMSHKSFFTDSVLIENEVCLSRPRTSTVSRRAQARNIKAIKILQKGVDEIDFDAVVTDSLAQSKSQQEFVRQNASVESFSPSRNSSIHSLGHIALAKKYARRISSTNSRTVHERLDGLIEEIDHLMEDAKDFAKANVKVQDQEEEELKIMNDMMNTSMKGAKTTVNATTSNETSSGKTEKTDYAALELPDAFKALNAENEKASENRRNPILAEDFFSIYMDSGLFAGMDSGNRPTTHVTRRSIRMVAEELHKKLDLLRNNPNIYELFQDRISHHKKAQMQRLRDVVLAAEGKTLSTTQSNFIERNRQFINNKELSLKSKREKMKNHLEEAKNVLDRKRTIEFEYREKSLQKMKDRDDHMEIERKRIETERLRKIQVDAQLKWSVLVILASKRQIIHDQVAILQNIYETNKRRFVAAVLIQRYWAKYREKLYQAGKLDKISFKMPRLPLDMAIMMLSNLVYRRTYGRTASSANIVRTFLLESLETSKMARMIQRYRRAVILAQQRFRVVQDKYRIQKILLSALWDKFENELWEEKTASIFKDSEISNDGKQKGVGNRLKRGATVVSPLTSKPKAIPDDVKFKVITDDLTRRRHEYWKRLAIYEKALIEWKAERPNAFKKSALLALALRGRRSTLLPQDAENASKSVSNRSTENTGGNGGGLMSMLKNRPSVSPGKDSKNDEKESDPNNSKVEAQSDKEKPKMPFFRIFWTREEWSILYERANQLAYEKGKEMNSKNTSVSDNNEQ